MAKHRPSYKWRAVKAAAFVWDLQIEKQRIKAGESAYKATLPTDANWAERFANEGLMRRRGIMRQTAEHFGCDVRTIKRYLDDVEREGWGAEVAAEFEEREERETPRMTAEQLQVRIRELEGELERARARIAELEAELEAAG
jgi:predicted RNase H-like nuclease (RuvC/YqgF family)